MSAGIKCQAGAIVVGALDWKFTVSRFYCAAAAFPTWQKCQKQEQFEVSHYEYEWIYV